ncbi:DUF995 domain-containing protein [Variovorax sp. J22G21]|uniref:DUF995 domain-containing protein n=1 Tax=Variovorax fucosicus TaxID=3053517 RepID=UPI002577AB56|nr:MULTISPECIES: DUF995 domain-containing protein [unclassified Variovorax]MDM0039653.1 DUF995 domain-containing protein [Variovorax sp. J22R193]MDM0064428.1 DUF995 domain-containing protein [Variovorax sp. J22G21]
MRLPTEWMPALLVSLGVAATAANAQDMVLRDLESKNPKKLSKQEATELLTGAKMSRVSGRGNVHYWSNDADGSFVVSSDNRGAGAVGAAGRPSTAPGKWHISDDGRYCVLIDWKGVPTEEWCRFILQTTDGYYGVRSDTVGTERVYKLEIKK